jgi:AraC family transcriptional activator of tynA and feaB
MACASEQEQYQQWLAQINQVCGRFNAPFRGTIHWRTGNQLCPQPEAQHRDRRWRKPVSLPSGDKNGNDAWFYTVFQLEGSAEIEQDDRRAILKPVISR